jgi:hypothetical protein
MSHHGLLALKNLLVLHVGVIHSILEIFLEAKRLLEACGELGEESLGLDGGWHKVGVITIGLFFFLVLGSIGAVPWQ